VRSPQDLSRLPRRSARRGRIWIVVVVIVLIILFASLKSLATFYTDYLWFGSVNLSSEWHRLFDVKIGLFFGFALIFFVLLWVNLAVVDRLAPGELSLGPEDELVRRYQQRVTPRAVLVRTVVSVVVALIAASGAIGQWRNYLLFVDGVYFTGPNRNDPQFHKNIGFFLFKLPFLSFIVQWAFVSLVVVAILVVIAHYLNGGIRVQSGAPSVAPQVKVHLSVILACMALVKAFGYVLARYNLDLTQNGYVQGATYTDVHARLPALTLLIYISLLAAVILLINIRRRGWALPVLGVGLWAFVAIVVGAIYPAIVQAVKVNPAQNSLERPYISRNIAATRYAMGINHVSQKSFSATQSLTPSEVVANSATLGNVQLWDPTQAAPTYTKLQRTRSYYSFNTLAIDRYTISGSSVPMVVGVRQVNDGDLPSQGWVNTHLQYTHGYGMILAPANDANSHQPTFDISQVPARSVPGAPKITQPRVYFGIANPADADYVLGDTRQPEIDFQAQGSANPHTSSYQGTGGVELSNFFIKAAFAIRFGDFNLLVSDLVTHQSRLMFVRDITEMAQKAAPFLSYDSDPYPVVANGQIYWILDAYTTSDNFPYAQNANTTSLPSNSGLNENFNYVRNSVKVVVNAYSGQMKFYDVTALTHTKDPILETWEKVFPHMFTPVSQMPASLRSHLRYPEDLLSVQSATYGRYHITRPLAFYNATNAWSVSPNAGAGSPNLALPTISSFSTTSSGTITTQVAPMAPEYELFKVPGQSSQTFNLVDAFVPVSTNDQIQTMSGMIVAGSDPSDYGKLTVFQTPPIDGPALVDADISATQAVSTKISFLNQNGSSVLFGTLQVVPVGNSMLYFRPFYVESSRNPFPKLDYYIVVYAGASGQSKVAFQPTLQQALQYLFQVNLNTGSPQPTGPSAPVSQSVQNLIAQANTDLQQAQTDLKAGNFAAYGSDESALQSVLQKLQDESQSTTGATTKTTTPKVAATTTTTTEPTGVALGTPKG
jgi:uncharacterized membrane protein (UPF0182 family)